MPNADPQLSQSRQCNAGGAEPMLPTERGKMWELLIQHVNEWRRPLAPGDGYMPEELDAVEAKLGFRLPLALREIYQLVGRRKDFVEDPYVRLNLPQYVYHDSGRFEIAEDDQSGGARCLWWISNEEWAKPDPLVVVQWDHGDDEGFLADEPTRLSTVFAQNTVWTLAAEQRFGKPGISYKFTRLSAAGLLVLERSFNADYLPPWNTTDDVCRFFSRPDAIAMTSGTSSASLVAKNVDVLKALLQELPEA